MNMNFNQNYILAYSFHCLQNTLRNSRFGAPGSQRFLFLWCRTRRCRHGYFWNRPMTRSETSPIRLCPRFAAWCACRRHLRFLFWNRRRLLFCNQNWIFCLKTATIGTFCQLRYPQPWPPCIWHGFSSASHFPPPCPPLALFSLLVIFWWRWFLGWFYLNREFRRQNQKCLFSSCLRALAVVSSSSSWISSWLVAWPLLG